MTFLLGYGGLWLGWACFRRPFTRQRIARGMVFLFVGVLLCMLFLETAAMAFVDPRWFGCGGCACPGPPSSLATSVFGLW